MTRERETGMDDDRRLRRLGLIILLVALVVSALAVLGLRPW